MAKRDPMELTAQILLIIGGLNWGLVIFGINLVTIISGGIDFIASIIYGLVAIAAIVQLMYIMR